jgi:hypothetical protein
MSEKNKEQKGAEPIFTFGIEELKTLVHEIKRDPEAEAAKEAKRLAREDYERREAQDRENKRLRVLYCNHKKGIDQDKWNIAWNIYADKIARGYCPKCEGIFEPGHPDYEKLRAVSAFQFDLTPAN